MAETQDAGTSRGRARLRPVFAAYAAQGLGYAIVVTALPAIKARVELTDGGVAGLLLLACVTAAAGSILADVIAVRRGSRWALAVGFAIQATALAGATVSTDVAAIAVAIAVYGIGLGTVDAAANMQGALAQTYSGVPVFGRLYAGYTAAGIVGAVLTSAVHAAGGFAVGTLAVAATGAAAMSYVSLRWADPAREARADAAAGLGSVPLPHKMIWVVGAFVFAAFVVDAAVASWSTVYLQDGLGASGSVAPLGYAAYLAVVLLTRLAADPLVRRFGGRPTVAIGIASAAVGCLVVAVVQTPAGAIVGFSAAGAAAGLVVPVAFGRAGELCPARRDEVMARVNLFNYGGAVVGAVVLGALAADSSALAIGFALPAVAILGVVPLLGRFRSASGESAAAPRPDRRASW
ncbi:MFS transporter [Skermania piniformis]|uniref:MFS transporter n=1 Tax=Skermania pinensis TaxID=39122 RepID=A0ABX8S8W4_9ACTN|nr:MFS transporter [Skermania piniformis]QXQ14303.1 MFS transporter [Skermania piniformis]